MVKFVIDLSFVIHYVEVDKFYSDEHLGKMLDKAVPRFTMNNPLFTISIDVIEKAKIMYPERHLVLDSLFGLCKKEDVNGDHVIDTLVKLAAICEVDDKETYVISDDKFIINSLNKTTHKAIDIKRAKEILGIS